MKSPILGGTERRTSRSGMRVVFSLTMVAMLCAGCTGGSGKNASEGPDPSSDLVKEQQDTENKELAEDLEPLQIQAPESGKLGSPKDAVQNAQSAVESVVNVAQQIAVRGDGQSKGIDQVADGFVKGQLEALAAERWQMGVHQVGEAKVVSVDTKDVDLDAKVPSMDLLVCLDLSGIDVVDENGNSFEGLLYKPKEPVLNTYGAIFTDGQWKISTHNIPEDSTCGDAATKDD